MDTFLTCSKKHMTPCANLGRRTQLWKLVGATPSLGQLQRKQRKLQQKLAPKDQWQLVDLVNNYFLARFKNADDSYSC